MRAEEEEYSLSMYQDLGVLNEKSHIRLKRHKIYGYICVEKRISPRLLDIYRFLQNNPSLYIPKIYECILDGECLIVIEEYVDGRNLEEILSERKMEEEVAAGLLLELCNALKVLHHASPVIICRDLKAANVMINGEGRVKIVDFNIARTYQQGKNRDTMLLGTAEYAAPEQFGYFQTDNRTDIYALGVLANYMVSGKFPVEQIVDGRLGQVVRKCICMEPKERYQTVEMMEQHLRYLYPQYSAPLDEPENVGENAQKNEKSFIPPGFRSKTPWKMAVAVMGYLMIAYVSFGTEFTRDGVVLTGYWLRFEQSMVWASQMFFVGIVCNYRGCKNKMPFLSYKNRIVRVLLYAAVDFVLILIAAAVCVTAEAIFM